jgi:GrpB-like predicted nucleotidyltransferase (UPF0157 family)
MTSDVAEALGLESGRVRVAAYDERWPALFGAESTRLQAALAAAGLDVALEHMGSTAVPGLAAKPIIDILGGLRVEGDRMAAIAALVAAGYVHRGEQGIPGRDFFRRGDPRRYHLHLTVIDSAFWNDHRAFRDWLRAHPEVAAEYARLKVELATRHPGDRESYTDGKTEFVRRVLDEAKAR